MHSRNMAVSAIAVALLVMGVGRTALGQLSDDERRCIDAVNKIARSIGNQEQKKDRACVKDGMDDIDLCVNGEAANAGVQRAKLVGLFDSGGKCETLPSFGLNSDPQSICNAVERAAGDNLRGAFGNPVNGIVAGDKCHDRIAKRMGKKLDTELKAFRTCIKTLPGITSGLDFDTCIASAIADDRAQNVVQPKLLTDIEGQCDIAGAPPAGLEDGSCSSCTDAASCAGCLGDLVDCQACQALIILTGVVVDCDTMDDSLPNSSCLPE
jgi:hypothetical protein